MNAADVQVRAAAEGDLAAVGRITLAAYSRLPGYTPEPDYRRELGDATRRLRDACLLVAVDGGDGRVVGTVTYVPGPGPMAEFEDAADAGVRMLAVDPAEQGRGIGAALLRACVERARAGSRRRIVLHSTPWMAAAHALYGRFGFRRAPDLDWTPSPDVPLLGYVLPLEGAE